MGEQWYCMVVGQEVGPVTSDDLMTMLEQGQIDADDTVRAGTEGEWQPVREVLDVSGVASTGVANPTEAATAVAEPPPSAHPTEAKPQAIWFTRMLGSEFGPFTFDEIREQAAQERLAPDDELREGPAGRWVAASTITGLFTDSAVRQRAIELEQAREDRERKKRERRALRRHRDQNKKSKSRPDNLLAGLDELDDADVAKAAAVASPFAAAAALPADPAARAEMLKKLDEEYQRLRSQLTAAPSPASPAVSGAAPQPPAQAEPRSMPAASSFDDPLRGSAPAREMPEPAQAAPVEPDRSPKADMMRDMAAAHIRNAQSTARPTPRTPSKSSSGGGGGFSFDFSSLNLPGKPIGIAVAVIGVLVIGFFGFGVFDFSSGAVYDQVVTLNAEYQKIADSETSSPEFTAFYKKFKEQQRLMLGELGSPSRGSTADDVRQGVIALGTAIEAHKRYEQDPERRQPFLENLEKQMTALKQEFGR